MLYVAVNVTIEKKLVVNTINRLDLYANVGLRDLVSFFILMQATFIRQELF